MSLKQDYVNHIHIEYLSKRNLLKNKCGSFNKR